MTDKEYDVELTRRRFFQALAASALVLGVPLAVGMPIRPKYRVVEVDYSIDHDAWFMALARAMRQTKQEVAANVFNRAFDKA